jgi:hypothetical protein
VIRNGQEQDIAIDQLVGAGMLGDRADVIFAIQARSAY